jgi:hypothetical protein
VEAAANADAVAHTQWNSEEDEAKPRNMLADDAEQQDILHDTAIPRLMWTHQPPDTDTVGIKAVQSNECLMADDNDDDADALEDRDYDYGLTDTTFLLAADWDDRNGEAAESMSYSS